MIHAVIALVDFELTVLFLAVLPGFVRAAGGERDRAAIRRPCDRADARLLVSKLHGFAAGWRDHVDLALAVAIASEGQPPRIGRPHRATRRLLPAGELVAL